MHSYFLSAAAVFICMCKRVRVCLPVCLVRPCVYLFMNSDGVFVCTVPLFQQKMRRHLLGDSELAVKKRERKCGGRRRKKKRKEKKNPRQPRDISILAPCFPQAAGRRLQNGSTPCHRVGSALSKCLWMENTGWKVSSFPLSSPLFFSSLAPLFSLPPLPYPPSVHPSARTERASHLLQWSSPWMLPFLSFCVSLSFPLAGTLPELSVSVRYLPVTPKSILH